MCSSVVHVKSSQCEFCVKGEHLNSYFEAAHFEVATLSHPSCFGLSCFSCLLLAVL